MKRITRKILLIIEVLIVIQALGAWCYYEVHIIRDTLENGITRIEGITGYAFDPERTDLLLHKSNSDNSVVMLRDWRPETTRKEVMAQLLATDKRWYEAQISETQLYDFAMEQLVCSSTASNNFRAICSINGGSYDYVFLSVEPGCGTLALVDIETGAIVMYISLIY